MSKERKQWIDVYKAILIICVVLGHSNFKYTEVIYWFHMPLFFIMSGFLWNSKESDCLGFIKKKVKRLFVPWITYFIVLEIIPAIFVEKIKMGGIIIKCLMFMWSGKIYPGVYWYIPTLMLTLVAIWFIEKLNKKSASVIVIILYIVGIVESILLIPYNIEKMPIFLCFPWNIDVCLISIMYVYIGIRLKGIGENFIKESGKQRNVLLFSCISVILILIFLSKKNHFNYIMDMKYSEYKNFIMPLLIPILFGYIILQCSFVLYKVSYINKVLELIGKASMIIMYIHIPIRQYIFEVINNQGYSAFVYTMSCCVIGVLIYICVYNKKIGVFLLGK